MMMNRCHYNKLKQTFSFFLVWHPIKLRHQWTRPSASARMGCTLNPERLQTEPCLKHKATLTGQFNIIWQFCDETFFFVSVVINSIILRYKIQDIRSPVSVALCFKHGSVCSRSGFKAQPMRALAGGIVHWCLNLIGCQTRKSITCWRQFYS